MVWDEEIGHRDAEGVGNGVEVVEGDGGVGGQFTAQATRTYKAGFRRPERGQNQCNWFRKSIL